MLFSRFLLTVFCCLGLNACGPDITDIGQISYPQGTTDIYRLGPGDVIRLSLYGDKSYAGEFGVSPSGIVSLPLIGDHPAQGETIEEFRAVVAAKLANGFYNDPRLNAEIVRFRSFYILGEVQKPGDYPYVAGLNLEQAVAIAGGYTYRANGRLFALQRSGTGIKVRLRSNETTAIQPGDTVTILERYF